MRSLIMNDVETHTEWSHLLGRGMAGKLKGRELTPLVSDMATWDAWKREHPGTTALDLSRTSRNYSSEFYREPSRFVFGFEHNGGARAIGLDNLLKHPLHPFDIDDAPLLVTFDSEGFVARLFSRSIDGKVLNFKAIDNKHMKDNQTGSVWNNSGGNAIEGEMKGQRLTPLVGIMSYRRAWMNFHPTSKDISP